jgi:hypothetical protein
MAERDPPKTPRAQAAKSVRAGRSKPVRAEPTGGGETVTAGSAPPADPPPVSAPGAAPAAAGSAPAAGTMAGATPPEPLRPAAAPAGDPFDRLRISPAREALIRARMRELGLSRDALEAPPAAARRRPRPLALILPLLAVGVGLAVYWSGGWLPEPGPGRPPDLAPEAPSLSSEPSESASPWEVESPPPAPPAPAAPAPWAPTPPVVEALPSVRPSRELPAPGETLPGGASAPGPFAGPEPPPAPAPSPEVANAQGGGAVVVPTRPPGAELQAAPAVVEPAAAPTESGMTAAPPGAPPPAEPTRPAREPAPARPSYPGQYQPYGWAPQPYYQYPYSGPRQGR